MARWPTASSRCSSPAVLPHDFAAQSPCMQLTPEARHDLIALGWSDDAQARAVLETLPDGRLARVSAQHRSGYVVATAIAREFPAQALAAWTRPKVAPDER